MLEPLFKTLQALTSGTLLKRDTNIGISCEYCEIFQNIYFSEHLRTTASGPRIFKPSMSYPVGNYMFKVNSRNIRTWCEICTKLTPCSSVSIANFEQVNAGLVFQFFKIKRCRGKRSLSCMALPN